MVLWWFGVVLWWFYEVLGGCMVVLDGSVRTLADLGCPGLFQEVEGGSVVVLQWTWMVIGHFGWSCVGFG